MESGGVNYTDSHVEIQYNVKGKVKETMEGSCQGRPEKSKNGEALAFEWRSITHRS